LQNIFSGLKCLPSEESLWWRCDMHVLAVAAFVISDLRFSGRVRQASHRLRLVTDDTKRFLFACHGDWSDL
jgi:hypothetical protein